MLATLKRLGLGLLLIALTSGILLYSDGANRKTPGRSSGKKPQYRVALIQHASQSTLEEGVEGILGALKSRGYDDGQRLLLKRYNAEGDLPTANAIAKDVTASDFDLIITASTLSLQTVANANRTGKKIPHVFGFVTDPYGAGVGISRSNHLDHPPYMAGYGSIQPVASAFKAAREMYPGLKRIGLVWNPTESNSETQTRIARNVSAEMGFELVEANAENTTGVSEAASSLVSRGVDAIWISGDVTVLVATDAVLAAARRARIPVFTVIPPTIKKGSLFDLGANPVVLGQTIGNLAADILDGANPAKIPVENFVPEMLAINEMAVEGLRDPWKFTQAVRDRAALVMDSGGMRRNAVNFAARAIPGRNYRIGLAFFAPEAGADICMKGIFDGLRELGFEEGKNLRVQRVHAQAEISNIPSMLQVLDASEADVILAMTTPVIGGAAGLVKRKPVVFTYCSDPIAAGAGKTFEDHLSHMTGIGSFPPVRDMVDLMTGTMPGLKSVGTVYNASEANSRKVVEVARGLFAKAGVKLEEATVAGTSEVLQAAQALASRKVQAFYIQGDNTVAQAFEVVVQAAGSARIPIFCDDPDLASRGGVACLGLGYYLSGYEVARPLARVLLGEKAAGIPFRNISERAVVLYEDRAEKLGLKFPAKILEEAKAQKAKNQSEATSAPKPATAAGEPPGLSQVTDRN